MLYVSIIDIINIYFCIFKYSGIPYIHLNILHNFLCVVKKIIKICNVYFCIFIFNKYNVLNSECIFTLY